MNKMVDLQNRVAELEQHLTNHTPAEKPSRRSAGYQSAPRNGVSNDPYGGATVDDAAYRRRQADEKLRREGLAAEEHRRATEGLPPGLFRDPFGLVRNRETGRLAEVETRQKEAVAAVEALIGEEQRERLDSGMSEEQLFDKPIPRKRTRRGKGKKGAGANKRAALKSKVDAFMQAGGEGLSDAK